MAKPSGFVPIRYRLTGLLLLALGTVGLLIKLIAYFAHQLVPPYLLPGSIALVLIGIYLLFGPPPENEQKE